MQDPSISDISGPTDIFTNYTDFESNHPYDVNMSGDPTNVSDIISTIYGGSCDYMRIHFTNMTFETYYDYLELWDQNNNTIVNFTGNYIDYMSPWYNANEIQITISSDESNVFYGYSIDYFQCVNGSQPVYSSSNWGLYSYNTTEDVTPQFDGGVQQTTNETYGWVLNNGYTVDDPGYAGYYGYNDGDEVELVQNLTIPRGSVLDAWVSTDYNIMHSFKNGDFFIFIKINGQEVYSKSFTQIFFQGFREWHHTGLIPLSLWDNLSNIFPDSLNDVSTLNISVGIKATNSLFYIGFDDVDYMMALFKNVQLILKTESNSTQPDINLEMNGTSVSSVDLSNIGGSTWGNGVWNAIGSWITNPKNLPITTISPQLDLFLDSNLTATHQTNTYASAGGLPGVTLTLNPDNSINWDFYHFASIPTYYQTYSFSITKPLNWTIISITDPDGHSVPFELGGSMNSIVTVNTSYAGTDGWWHIRGGSPNWLALNNLCLWNGTAWENYSTNHPTIMNFTAGNTISLKVGINLQYGTITNLQNTTANLTIYDPSGNVWKTQKIHANNSGELSFQSITTSASDIPGKYIIQIIWTNGTIAGGILWSFQLNAPPSYTWLYFAIPGGLLFIGLVSVIVKQNVINPRRARRLALLEKKTQMLSDLQNIRVILILQKSSGLPMFSQVINTRQEIDETLLTGFVQAISLFSANMAQKQDAITLYGDTSAQPPTTKFESLEFIHNNFNILVIDGNMIRVAAILDHPASESVKNLIKQMVERFEGTYGQNVLDWNGDTLFFSKGGHALVSELFNVDLMKDYKINQNVKQDTLKDLIRPNTISSTVYNFMITLSKDQGFFKLSTITSLISEANRLEAKNIILEFINAQLIIPISSEDRVMIEGELVEDTKELNKDTEPINNADEIKFGGPNDSKKQQISNLQKESSIPVDVIESNQSEELIEETTLTEDIVSTEESETKESDESKESEETQ